MTASASNLAHSLSRHAEAVCRHYLSNGRRSGGYWIVGDVRNAPGASTFVRLKSAGPSKGAAGKWTDYVARRVMLRPRAGRRCCEGSAASAQHNLSPSGRVA